MATIDNILNTRKSEGLFRTLKHEITATDFCSNDYLGVARSKAISSSILAQVSVLEKKNGATGSRLLSGNSELYNELESQIASFHNSESALLYPSGYQANVGLLSCLGTKEDTFILVSLVHASLIDGARLSKAKRFKFLHNDVADLKKKLRKSTGNIYVIVEGLYSMDGDISKLQEISTVCEKANAKLIVDEAHSVGILGEHGAGLVSKLGLENKVFARIVTYGKAFGSHGAAILGSASLRDWLVNFSRSFIYSTGLPPFQLIAIQEIYQAMPRLDEERKKLWNTIEYFRSKQGEHHQWLPSSSPIQSLIIQGNDQVKKLAESLQTKGFEVFPILSPTVAVNTERIRFCIHAYNTEKEIDQLFEVINTSLNVD